MREAAVRTLRESPSPSSSPSSDLPDSPLIDQERRAAPDASRTPRLRACGLRPVPPPIARQVWSIGYAGWAYRRRGRGEGGPRCRVSHGPQALYSHALRHYDPHGLHAQALNRNAVACFRALGHDQPRDSHVHGAPHTRAKPTEQLMQYERGVCARRTVTKYRNIPAAVRHQARLGAAHVCLATDIVAAAGSSGRRAADG